MGRILTINDRVAEMNHQEFGSPLESPGCWHEPGDHKEEIKNLGFPTLTQKREADQ